MIFLYRLTFCLLAGLMVVPVFSQSFDKDSTMVYVTGEGLNIKLGKAEGTKINLLTTTQPGFQTSSFDSSARSGATTSNRMSLNLVRIALNVQTFKDKVTMGLVTDFTGTSPILEAWGAYAFSKNAKLIFGQLQTHTNNRLAMADERYAQVMSQSIAGTSTDGIMYGGLMHNFVSTTREGGLYLETNFSLNKIRIYPSVSITSGQGQNAFDNQDIRGFKYGGRLDFMPLGDFIKNNAFIAHDIYREPKPKLALGVAGSINVNARSVDGSGIATLAPIFNKDGELEFANYRKLAADFIFKSKGFALVGEYMVGTVTGANLFTNATATNKLTEEVASTLYNLGSAINFQSSYVLKSGWAIDGRYSVVTPEFESNRSRVRNQNWYTMGINRFMMNNAVKAGINVTYIEDTFPNATAKRWVGNFAVQLLL